MTKSWLAQHTNAGSANPGTLDLISKTTCAFTDGLQKPSFPVAISELSAEGSPRLLSFGALSSEIASNYRLFTVGKILFFVSAKLLTLLAGLRLGMSRSLIKEAGASENSSPKAVSPLELSLAAPAIQQMIDVWLTALIKSSNTTVDDLDKIVDIGWGTNNTNNFLSDEEMFVLGFNLNEVKNIVLIALPAKMFAQAETASSNKTKNMTISDIPKNRQDLLIGFGDSG